MHARYTRSMRRALLAPLIGILVLVPAILSVQYVIQVRSLRAAYERHSHEVAMRVADLIGFSYRHVAELYADLLPSVTACHEQIFAELPADPAEINVSNRVARSLALLPAGLHFDVAVVSREYRILDTTYRQELGLDLSGFPDAVAAFSEAARTGRWEACRRLTTTGSGCVMRSASPCSLTSNWTIRTTDLVFVSARKPRSSFTPTQAGS